MPLNWLRHQFDGVAGLNGHVLALEEEGGFDVGGLAFMGETNEFWVHVAGVFGSYDGLGQGQVFGPGDDGVADPAFDRDDLGLGTGLGQGLFLAGQVGPLGFEAGVAFGLATGGEGKEY